MRLSAAAAAGLATNPVPGLAAAEVVGLIPAFPISISLQVQALPMPLGRQAAPGLQEPMAGLVEIPILMALT